MDPKNVVLHSTVNNVCASLYFLIQDAPTDSEDAAHAHYVEDDVETLQKKTVKKAGGSH